MRKNGYGRIVNITSHLGSLSTMGAGNVSYRISKTGLNALTGVLAAELEGSGILVNAVSPGRMDTRMAYGETGLVQGWVTGLVTRPGGPVWS
jgi:NAD(P)-dependent dehydrogenase (short-subunit alcohol dehydrogenase family)